MSQKPPDLWPMNRRRLSRGFLVGSEPSARTVGVKNTRYLKLNFISSLRPGPPSGNLKIPESHLQTGTLLLQTFQRCLVEDVAHEVSPLTSLWLPSVLPQLHRGVPQSGETPGQGARGLTPSLRIQLDVQTFSREATSPAGGVVLSSLCDVLCCFCRTDVPHVAALLLLLVLFGIVFFLCFVEMNLGLLKSNIFRPLRGKQADYSKVIRIKSRNKFIFQ